MLRGLKVINLSPNSDLHSNPSGEVFYLKTCQRQLIVGFNTTPHRYPICSSHQLFEGQKAYMFLLETICGLKSRMLGESEIVAQFKDAFTSYLAREDKNPYVIQVFEKLFKDAKEIRTKYLARIGQLSYAGLTKKFLLDESKDREVLIFGSGQLAYDLCKVLNRKFKITLCARNNEKVQSLSETFGLQILAWDKKDEGVNHPFIVNTIGAEKTVLFDKDFLNSWSQINATRRFIDLGSPSVLEVQKNQDTQIILLENLLSIAEKLSQEKEEKVSQAALAIEEKTVHRFSSFNLNFPFGWEELSFA
jgi:glutamyl-tRNA reductase